jgi:hypothetical protein
MANGKIPNFNNKFYGDKLVEVTFPDSTGSLGFDEYNAVLNNANSSITSSKIMNADYALNARIPTNNDRLISGTAQRMEIQDSNYSSVAWTSPRYVGSQTISATYNDYTPSGSSVTFADGTVGPWKGDQVFDEYPGDETFTRGNPLGKVPAIDLYSTHFVLFDRIQIDTGFQNNDYFHCLYLIDDQGNKQPLTYRNKNLVDLQRIFVKGSNAEVVFLGQNNQEVLDEYSIINVGRFFDDKAFLVNDLFSTEFQSPQDIRFVAEVASTQDGTEDGRVLTNAVFKFNGLNSHTYQFTFSPSLFSASLAPNGNYRLKYLENVSLRSSLSGSAYQQYILKSKFTAPGNFMSQSQAFTYESFSTGSGWNSLLWDSKLEPFYILSYNPINNKIFENTIYETSLEYFNFKSQDPTLPTFPLIQWANAANNIFINPPTEISPQSTFTSNYSPLTIGDTINLTRTNYEISINPSQISSNPLQASEDLKNVVSYGDVINLTVKDIKLPGDVIIDYTLGNNLINSTIDNPGGFSSPPPPGGYWISNEITTDFTSTVTLGQFNLGTYDSINITTSTILLNTVYHITPDAVHWIKIHIDQFPLVGSWDGWFDQQMHQGDIIELKLYSVSAQEELGSWRYMVLTNVWDSTGIYGTTTARIQFLNGSSSPISTIAVDGNDLYFLYISKCTKFDAPYIEVSCGTDLSTEILNGGNAFTIRNIYPHEQYIESQNLSGSGVGVIIPENYDPKLREQLPDIINKTGIDINSLVQGNN